MDEKLKKEDTTDVEDEKEISGGYRAFLIIRSVVVYLFAIVILVAAALFAADRNPDKSLFGYRYYTVLTDSMIPEFASGDMVFVKVMGADGIEKGDIITFNPSSNSDAYLTHRVVDKIVNYEGSGVTCFRTKGDNNNTEDSFLVDEERVIGIVKFHVPKLGIIIRFLQMRWYFVVPLVILLFVFLGLLKHYFELRDEDEPEDEDNSTPSDGAELKIGESGSKPQETSGTEEKAKADETTDAKEITKAGETTDLNEESEAAETIEAPKKTSDPEPANVSEKEIKENKMKEQEENL